MSWKDCSRYCKGQCPCPDPPWLWKCNQTPHVEMKNPQKAFTRSYLCSLPYDIWDGTLL